MRTNDVMPLLVMPVVANILWLFVVRDHRRLDRHPAGKKQKCMKNIRW